MNTYPINMESTEIFDRIMSLYDEAISEGKGYLKLDNDSSYMYLAVEKPYEGMYPDNEDIVSLAHYGRQNGDAMRDPEMLFLYKDGRYFPMYYHNDYMHVVQESMYLSGEKWKVHPGMQKGQRDFANMWLKNIRVQHGV